VEAVRSWATLSVGGWASWGLEHAKLFWAGILDNLDCALTWLDEGTAVIRRVFIVPSINISISVSREAGSMEASLRRLIFTHNSKGMWTCRCRHRQGQGELTDAVLLDLLRHLRLERIA